MKVFAVLLLATFALGHQTQQSEWKQFYNFAVAKAMESCLGKDNVNKYTVNMKKAVAKCQQQDAPELDLPPFRSMYKFVNTIISSADQMDQQKLHQVFGMLRMMNNQPEYNNYNNYNNHNSGSNWLKEKFMKYKMHQMMKQMMNEDEDNFHVRPYSSDNKMDNYAPPQARYRFKRQASGSTKPVDYIKPVQGLDKGDRLFAKLQEQKKDMEAHVGNMTCVLRETKVLNKENEIDVQSLKKSMEQFTMPSPWFKNRFDEVIDICYETAVNIPASIVDEHNIEGDFGSVNLAHVKTFMKCLKEGKQKLCMNQDTKNKIESNFGPIKTILEETKLTEYQLFPLVQQMLQGEESEYMGFM